MATESPIRMLETSGKWPSPKETCSAKHGRFFCCHRKPYVPQNSSLNARYANLNSLIENCEPEEQLRADPAYLAYYCSKINLNPRLPPPLISWENRRLVRHIGSFGNKSEDDRSPQKPSDDWEDQSSAFWSGQDAALLAGQHRSSVDLIQYTISFIGNVKQVTTTLCLFTLKKSKPLFKNGIHWEMHYKSSSRSLIHGSPGKTVEHDADSSSLHDSSVGTSNLVASTLVTDNLGPSSNANPAIAPVSNSLSLDGTGSTPPSPALIERDAHNLDVHLEDDVLIGGITVSDFVSTESKMKDSNTSSLPNSGNKKNQEDWLHNRQKNWLQHQVHQQQGNSFQVQGAKSQMVFQGTNHTNINMDQYLHGSSKFSTEAQPVLQSSGFTPPLYATAAAYMTSANPFYPNLQPPAGYPPHGAIPLAFDNTVGPSFNAQTSAVSTGESITQAVDMQHLNKFYGQLGYAPQPSFVSGQFDPLVSRGGVIGSQVSAFETQRKRGIASPNYHGSPTNMGMLMQFPTSPLASPVLPRSPAGIILYFNFSADQHGSFIQQKLENCIFEHGNPEQRKELASQLAGQILPLSLQMYGCR
ncbi:hypothetical protein AAG906_007541 [Vitis piasezkii]